MSCRPSNRQHEGPNDEEQGGAIDRLATREPLVASWTVPDCQPTRRVHRFIVPTGINRSGAGRAASLEPVFPETLMEAVVDYVQHRHSAWKNVKANRGAAGPDGITITEFPEWISTPLDRDSPTASRWYLPPWSGAEKGYRQTRWRSAIVRYSQRELIDLIQQAIVQVLTPLFDPHFSESSFGFRPNRSAHGAAKQVQCTIRRGHRYAADVDLSKFFDRVQHDVLMARVVSSRRRTRCCCD